MSMLLSLVLAYFVTATLNGGIDFRADGTVVAPTRFEQFLHGCWLTFFFSATFFATERALTHSWTRWRLGPYVSDIGQQAHNPFVLVLFLALGGLALWVLVTLVHLPWAYRAAKGRSRYQWEFLVASIAVLALYAVPRSFLHHATLVVVGPGSHAGALLSHAVAAGDERTVTRLLEHGDAIDGSNEEGQRALRSAINTDRADIVQRLLARGADVSAELPFEGLPFGLAAAKGNEEIGRLLIARGAAIPCATWHVQQWKTYAESRGRLERGFVDKDSVNRRLAARSDSVTSAWAAAFGRVSPPCDSSP